MHNFVIGDRVWIKPIHQLGRVLGTNPWEVAAPMNPQNPTRRGTVLNKGHKYVKVQWEGTKKTSAGYYHPDFLEIRI